MAPARFPDGFERRAAVELRAVPGARRLQGLAAVFGREARIADSFTEVLLPGCFAGSLDGRDIVGLFDHDPAKVLGRIRAGTLKLSETREGLWFELGELPDTTAANDCLALVRSGNAGGCSFGFTVTPGGERWAGQRRELSAVDLRELSIVSAFPAYEGTSVSARARELGYAAALARRRFLETL